MPHTPVRAAPVLLVAGTPAKGLAGGPAAGPGDGTGYPGSEGSRRTPWRAPDWAWQGRFRPPKPTLKPLRLPLARALIL